MKLRMCWGVAALMMGCMLVSMQLHAGDKVEPKKDAKKEEIKEERKDTVVDDALTNADVKDKVLTQSYCKTYTYKMTQGRKYQIDLISANFDAYLRLENPKGEQVASDDDSGGMLNSRIIYQAPVTGDFTVCAMSLGGGSTGKFKLIVKDLNAGNPQAGGKSLDIKNNKGQGNYTGSLDGNDGAYMGKRHKLLTFPMEAGKTYQIDMTSTAFDPYLILEDPDQKVLARDDDGGGFPNARITIKAAKTGKHRIIATYFGNGNGEFNVTIRQTDGGNEEPKDAKKD
jgi:hypothetical protein